MTDWPVLSGSPSCRSSAFCFSCSQGKTSAYGRRNILNVSLLTTVFTFLVSL